jgi:HECT-like ubiquitin-transferase
MCFLSYNTSVSLPFPERNCHVLRFISIVSCFLLQHYQGDISGLELYFVIVNNEYGEQTEEELIPGGKNVRVTNENVIPFIHLIANHRLNYQVIHLISFCLSFHQISPW